MILVSACLCGVDCKYNGKNNKNERVLEFLKDREYLIICPEQMGGMTTPRTPSEIKGEEVFSKNREDVTNYFLKGAVEALKVKELVGAKYALLKEGSPSCGCHKVYDGTFKGIKIEGIGITAKKLKEAGVLIFSEEEVEDLEKQIEENK